MRHHAYLCTGFEEKGIVGTCPMTLQRESVCARYSQGIQFFETKRREKPVLL